MRRGKVLLGNMLFRVSQTNLILDRRVLNARRISEMQFLMMRSTCKYMHEFYMKICSRTDSEGWRIAQQQQQQLDFQRLRVQTLERRSIDSIDKIKNAKTTNERK